jgi:hypothetical protein
MIERQNSALLLCDAATTARFEGSDVVTTGDFTAALDGQQPATNDWSFDGMSATTSERL